MSKLHELLAVESDLKGQADACRADLKNTFEKKTHHFTKKNVTFKSVTDGVPDKTESQLALQTTVEKELKWISEKLTKAIDTGYQIDVANTTATADVVLDNGTVLLKALPTTGLLRLEHRIVEIRDLIHSIGTLDPAKGFEPDTAEGPGIYRARDEEKTRGEKVFSYIVMVQPTDKFPAQVKELMTDQKSGTLLTQEWSSLITVSAKAEMLDRVENLLRAIKKARARANELDIDVRQNQIAPAVLSYVFGVQ